MRDVSDLRRAQEALVAALTGTGPIPDGFDPDRLAAAARALLRKRSGEVAKSWPLLRAFLGDTFGGEFAAWAEHRPTAGSWRDGWDFAADLQARGALGQPARRELAERRLTWSYDGVSAPRRRRLPAAGRLDGRPAIQVRGRIVVLGLRRR
jgi:hypothetical protein